MSKADTSDKPPPGDTTSFGFTAGRRGRAPAPRQRRVRDRRRALRPDERPDVGRPAPAVEGRPRRLARAAKSARRFDLIDVAGGTGDISRRVLEAGGAGCRAVLCDISPGDGGGGPQAPGRGQPGRARRLRHRQRRGAAVSGPSRSTPTPSPSASATSRTSTGRSPRPIACSKPAGASCAWSSPPARCRCSTASTTSIPSRSSRGWAQLAAGSAEPYRYLVESIRKFPTQEPFADMIRAAGFAPRHLPQPHRRHRRDPFGVAALSGLPARRTCLASLLACRVGILRPAVLNY